MARSKKSSGPNHLALRAGAEEIAAYRTLAAGLRDTPIPSGEILANVPLFLTRSSFSPPLFLDDLYRRIPGTPGQIFEFPGETTAVLDELGVSGLRLQRDPRGAHPAFIVIA